MEQIRVDLIPEGGSITFNGQTREYTTYGAALSEARFLMYYRLFQEHFAPDTLPEGYGGTEIIRTKNGAEYIFDGTHNKTVTKMKLEKWDLGNWGYTKPKGA